MQGDWAPGTTMRLVAANVMFDPANPGTILNVGVGYEVVLPSGVVAAARGHNLPQGLHKNFQALIDLMISDAIKTEGLDGLAKPKG